MIAALCIARSFYLEWILEVEYAIYCYTFTFSHSWFFSWSGKRFIGNCRAYMKHRCPCFIESWVSYSCKCFWRCLVIVRSFMQLLVAGDFGGFFFFFFALMMSFDCHCSLRSVLVYSCQFFWTCLCACTTWINCPFFTELSIWSYWSLNLSEFMPSFTFHFAKIVDLNFSWKFRLEKKTMTLIYSIGELVFPLQIWLLVVRKRRG